MRAKDYFRKIEELEQKINSNKQLIKYFRELATGVSSPKITDMPRTKKENNDPTVKALIRVMELEEETKNLELEFKEKKILALELINTMETKEHQIILLKYFIEKKTIRTISKELFYSRQWCYKLYEQALSEFEEELSKRVYSSLH